MAETPLQRFSKAVFGNSYRLEVAAAIHDARGPFSVLSISDASGLPYGRVQEVMRGWIRAELLRPVNRPGTTKLYRPARTKYWEMCHRLKSDGPPRRLQAR